MTENCPFFLERRIRMNRFFKIVFGIMLLCLILCVAQLVRIEFGYELLNFLDERNAVALNPRQVARQYILALKKKDYRIAYDYLAPESKEMFSLIDFITINEKSMTLMNENKTWIAIEEVTVGMQIYEDPGSWGYLLVKHKGKWKVVMMGGIPSFPFLCDCCCK
jgi:hypothetical protein